MASLQRASALSGISTPGVSQDPTFRVIELQAFGRQSPPPPSLPAVGQCLSGDGILAFGIAAGRWLLLLDDSAGDSAVQERLQQFQGSFASVVELSSARVIMRLSVDREVLERCCSLDLESMPVEGCTMARFAACHVLLARQHDGWLLCVERPQARHVAEYVDCVMQASNLAKNG